MVVPTLLKSPRMLLRLLRIGRTLRRHDAGEALHALGLRGLPLRLLGYRPDRRRAADGRPRPGKRLAAALTELGPSFIKLGQSLSTRADILGEQLAIDLSDLQDRVPPFSHEEAVALVESEFGQPLDELFESFDTAPVSAASIAQVHFAVTREQGDSPGEPVAVKILRPGIEAAFERDLELFFWLAELAYRAQPRLRRLKPVEVVEVFAQQVRLEMDLRFEASGLSEIAQNFDGDDSYLVPTVDWRRTSRRVLTMSRVSGIPIDDRAALLAAGLDLTEVLRGAATIFFKQVFRDGLFHGDQHPGNMWINAEGQVVAVDFGILGRLDRRTRYFLADMMVATLQRDYRRLAEIQVEAGYLPNDRSLEVFAQALRSVCEPIIDRPLNQISFAKLLGQLFQLTESFEMPVQPQLLLLQKNMMMAEGVSRRLSPDLNIWTLAQPLIEDWIRANRGVAARLEQSAQDIFMLTQRLPQLVDDITVVAGHLRKQELEKEEREERQDRNFSVTLGLVEVLALAVLLLAAFFA